MLDQVYAGAAYMTRAWHPVQLLRSGSRAHVAGVPPVVEPGFNRARLRVILTRRLAVVSGLSKLSATGFCPPDQVGAVGEVAVVESELRGLTLRTRLVGVLIEMIDPAGVVCEAGRRP